MAMEKRLAPPNRFGPQMDEEAIEIEIVNPEAMSIETPDGGMIFDFDANEDEMGNIPFDANLAEFIEDKDLALMSSELVGLFKSDKESRADWERTYIEGLDLLGLKHEDRTTP